MTASSLSCGSARCGTRPASTRNHHHPGSFLLAVGCALKVEAGSDTRLYCLGDRRGLRNSTDFRGQRVLRGQLNESLRPVNINFVDRGRYFLFQLAPKLS
jgi:hypothetical protein